MPVGVHFALVDRILDRIAALRDQFALEAFDEPPQVGFTGARFLEVRSGAAADAAFFSHDRSVERVDLRLERPCRGIAGFELGEQLGIVRLHQRTLLAQSGDSGVLERRRGYAARCV